MLQKSIFGAFWVKFGQSEKIPLRGGALARKKCDMTSKTDFEFTGPKKMFFSIQINDSYLGVTIPTEPILYVK